MSEGRQLLLLVLGGVVLAAIGIVGAIAFPEPCEEVEGIGSLELAFADAAPTLAVPAADGAAVEALGEQLGIGVWRGAVALPSTAEVLPSDFGFFVVTGDDLVALRPGSGLASAPRDVAGDRVVGVSGTAAGIVTADRTVAVVGSDYERERCGTLPPDGEVLAVDRGFALLRRGDGVELWSLSGDRLPTPDVAAPVRAGVIDGDTVVLATDEGIVATSLRDGAVTDERSIDDPVVLADVHGTLLVAPSGAGAGVVALAVDAGGLVTRDVPLPEPVLDAAPTPAGVVGVSRSAVVTDRGTAAALPDALEPGAVVTSEDGQVGVVVEAPAGRVLLVWGRDLPPGVTGD